MGILILMMFFGEVVLANQGYLVEHALRPNPSPGFERADVLQLCAFYEDQLLFTYPQGDYDFRCTIGRQSSRLRLQLFLPESPQQVRVRTLPIRQAFRGPEHHLEWCASEYERLADIYQGDFLFADCGFYALQREGFLTLFLRNQPALSF